MKKYDIFDFIRDNDINEIKEWIDLYYNDINIKHNNGYTPLHIACYYDHLEIVQYLIDKGADVNSKYN